MKPQLQYQFSDTFAMRFGYKRLHYESEEGDGRRQRRVQEMGRRFQRSLIEPGLHLPGRHPVEPAPAPIVAAAPEKCADSDGDGVRDTADQCPNTPPGNRVGRRWLRLRLHAATHFAFDSAKLLDKSSTRWTPTNSPRYWPTPNSTSSRVRSMATPIVSANPSTTRNCQNGVPKQWRVSGVERCGNGHSHEHQRFWRGQSGC